MGLRGHACQSREEACFPVDPLELGMGGIFVPPLLLLRLGRSLRFCFLLLLCVFGPRRYHSAESHIGVPTAEVFGGLLKAKTEHPNRSVLSHSPVTASSGVC